MAKMQLDLDESVTDFLKVEKVKRRHDRLTDTLIECIKEIPAYEVFMKDYETGK